MGSIGAPEENTAVGGHAIAGGVHARLADTYLDALTELGEVVYDAGQFCRGHSDTYVVLSCGDIDGVCVHVHTLHVVFLLSGPSL